MPEDQLEFFNYHEFLVETSGTSPSLVVNHFPNNYCAQDSLCFATTRIVRVPRCYTSSSLSDIIPQFSNFVPGTETAALSNSNVSTFTVAGSFDGNIFGITSLTPLVPALLSPHQFQDIVNSVNDHLYRAFNPYSYQVVIENTLQVLSGGLFSSLWNRYISESYSKRELLQLERYIESLNDTLAAKDVKIISPRLSGYLSLDFQIPKPQETQINPGS